MNRKWNVSKKWIHRTAKMYEATGGAPTMGRRIEKEPFRLSSSGQLPPIDHPLLDVGVSPFVVDTSRVPSLSRD